MGEGWNTYAIDVAYRLGLDPEKLMAKDRDEISKLMLVLNGQMKGSAERLVYNKELDGVVKLEVVE